MNRFDVVNRLSEYLDGQLLGSQREAVEAEIKLDPSLHDKVQRYRMISERIGRLPRYPMPLHWDGAEKKSKKKSRGNQDRIVIRKASKRTWMLRTLVETTLLSALVFLILASISRVRNIEKNSNRNENLSSAGLSEIVDLNSVQEDSESNNSSQPVAPIDMKSLKVGPGEIWRIHVKTDSPRELRNRIIARLEKIGISQPKSVEAPGGIQFDLMVPSTQVNLIKTNVEELAQLKDSDTADGKKMKTFNIAWYKTRSRTEIPAGQTRVVLWLSQM